MKYLKSAVRLLDRDSVNRRGLDLSKEVQQVSVGQSTAELPAIKVGGWKKDCAAYLQIWQSSSTFKAFYLRSKYPHFNSTYSVRVRFSLAQLYFMQLDIFQLFDISYYHTQNITLSKHFLLLLSHRKSAFTNTYFAFSTRLTRNIDKKSWLFRTFMTLKQLICHKP